MTWGLFTASLLFALTVSNLLLAVWRRIATKPANLTLIVFVLVNVSAVIKWPGLELSLAAYIWSVLADVSLATFLFISYYTSVLLFENRSIARYQPVSLALAVVVLSLVYYPLVLGFDAVDIYSWGMNSPVLIAITGIIAFALSFTGYSILALWGALTLAAWASDLGESVNLFDYLLDPIAFFWGIYILFRHWHDTRKINRYEQDMTKEAPL